MFERLTTGWDLAMQSFRVLKLDKELLIFPILSAISCVLVMATFAIPLFLSGAIEGFQEKVDSPAYAIASGAVGFAYYFVNFFVILFFNSALVGCAVIRLKGGNPTVADGFQTAFSRLPQIAGWALVSATVGIILKALESRSNRIGQILISLLGMAWSIMTFFVVPIFVIEKLGPFAAISRSISLMKGTWGESLAANFSLGLIVFLASLLAIIPIGIGVFLIASEALVLGIVSIVLGVLFLLAVSLITSAVNSILLAALYIYAAEGQIAKYFDGQQIQHAFARK